MASVQREIHPYEKEGTREQTLNTKEDGQEEKNPANGREYEWNRRRLWCEAKGMLQASSPKEKTPLLKGDR